MRDKGSKAFGSVRLQGLATLLVAGLVLVGCETVGGLLDSTPPSVTITSPADGTAVGVASIDLNVRVVDDGTIASVSFAVNTGDTGTCSALAGDSYRCSDVALDLGVNDVTVTATDGGGNTGSDTIEVTRNATGGNGQFSIGITFFDESFTPSQKAAFDTAASIWETLITSDLADVTVDYGANEACGQGEPSLSGTIDDLMIFATSFTGSVGGVLGSAGPCRSRSSGTDGGTNVVGFMQFDTADVDELETAGELLDVIVHEMGHVLGIGTNWDFDPFFDLLDYLPYDGPNDCSAPGYPGFTTLPTYTGTNGVAAWIESLGGVGNVPVEDAGGAGTWCAHWDEETFGNELMTGYLDAGANPLSILTARSLEDIGYTVDLDAVDGYVMPTSPALRLGGGIDLAAREILLRPIGTVDVDHDHDHDHP